jgi:hypothetical protein
MSLRGGAENVRFAYAWRLFALYMQYVVNQEKIIHTAERYQEIRQRFRYCILRPNSYCCYIHTYIHSDFLEISEFYANAGPIKLVL